MPGPLMAAMMINLFTISELNISALNAGNENALAEYRELI